MTVSEKSVDMPSMAFAESVDCVDEFSSVVASSLEKKNVSSSIVYVPEESFVVSSLVVVASMEEGDALSAMADNDDDETAIADMIGGVVAENVVVPVI